MRTSSNANAEYCGAHPLIFSTIQDRICPVQVDLDKPTAGRGAAPGRFSTGSLLLTDANAANSFERIVGVRNTSYARAAFTYNFRRALR